MTTLFIFVLAYFGFLGLLSLAAKPYRLRLHAAATRLCDNASLSPSEDKMLKSILSSAYSIRAAPMLLLVFMTGILRRSEQIDTDADSFAQENPSIREHYALWHTLLETHMISAFAVNPIFGSLAYVAKWILRTKARAYFARTKRASRNLDLYEIRALAV